jgi:ABC-type polysaccharide/polyol phosphate export permease
MLNPLVGIIEGFRGAVFGHGFHWRGLAFSVVVTGLLLSYSMFAFRRMEKNFADII